jgi:hypothetical protein
MGIASLHPSYELFAGWPWYFLIIVAGFVPAIHVFVCW